MDSIKVGDVLSVSNCIAKQKGVVSTENNGLLGRYYADQSQNHKKSRGIVVFPQRGTELRGEYGDIWQVKVTRVLDKCIIGIWQTKVGEWR